MSEKKKKVRISTLVDEELMSLIEKAMAKLGMTLKPEFYRMALREKALRVVEGRE
jgi:hypothetical protein